MGDSFQENSQNRRDNGEQRFVVIAIRKTPGLNQIGKADSLFALPSARNLRFAEGFEQVELDGLVIVVLDMSD